MLKHTLTYEDFDGEEVTEELYFNLSKPELLEMEVEHDEGMYEWINRIVKIKDRKTLIAEWKKLILMAYGEKSADGRSFVKTDELREAFSHTAAFQKFFMDLSTDDEVAATFIKGILPKDLSQEVAKAMAEEKAVIPPKTDD